MTTKPIQMPVTKVKVAQREDIETVLFDTLNVGDWFSNEDQELCIKIAGECERGGAMGKAFCPWPA